MKRILVFSLLSIVSLLFLLDASLTGASLTVTTPTANATLHKDHTYTITWTSTGLDGQRISILLVSPGGQTILHIADLLPIGSGSFPWKVPNNLQTGQYKIRAKTLDELVSGDSKVINIIAQVGFEKIKIRQDLERVPMITVTNPKAGNVWHRKTTHTITWTKWGEQIGTVSIRVTMPDRVEFKRLCEQVVPNNGSFTWHIDPQFPLGAYRISVGYEGGGLGDVYGYSEVFSIGSNNN